MDQKNNIIAKIRRYGNGVIWIAIIIEMVFWPSIENTIGCLMALTCWVVFCRVGLREDVIREHIFGWLVFLSMSLYRILPLLATMLEFHSIGYNFVNPVATYLGETILFLFSAFAFHCAVKRKNSLRGLKNLLSRCGFYDRVSDRTIWMLGMFGLIIKLYLMNSNIQIGDVIGKTLSGFSFFQYAPLMLFFPSLYNKKQNYDILVKNKTATWYFVFIVVLAFATNSRYTILEPFGTFALLLFISYLQCSKNNCRTIKIKHVLYGIISILFIVPFFSDVSLAMLANRSIRTDVRRTDLFDKTMETYLDREKMEQLRKLKESSNSQVDYSEEWSETYVSNFALNRYCNLRVSDNTLYHAQRVGFFNEKMYDDFWTEIVALCPMPILNFFGVKYNKNERYSRGDKLKAMSTESTPFASYLVTSHLADGLLTFGYFYFPIEGLLFYLRFLFLDTFLIRRKTGIVYSVYGLITIFSFLAMFRNAGGCCDSLSYLLRGYWQDIILFLIGFSLLKKFTSK
ncbi:MAG: hypothetical protein KHX42_08240 [Prevotella sp.]|nr:hypothetical protein [Prevotella sp.]